VLLLAVCIQEKFPTSHTLTSHPLITLCCLTVSVGVAFCDASLCTCAIYEMCLAFTSLGCCDISVDIKLAFPPLTSTDTLPKPACIPTHPHARYFYSLFFSFLPRSFLLFTIHYCTVFLPDFLLILVVTRFCLWFRLPPFSPPHTHPFSLAVPALCLLGCILFVLVHLSLS